MGVIDGLLGTPIELLGTWNTDRLRVSPRTWDTDLRRRVGPGFAVDGFMVGRNNHWRR